MAKRHYGEVLSKYNPDSREAKTLFSALKALQRRLDGVASSLKARAWAEVEADSAALLHEVEEALRSRRQTLWLALAQARFHLKRDDDSILEAADVRGGAGMGCKRGVRALWQVAHARIAALLCLLLADPSAPQSSTS